MGYQETRLKRHEVSILEKLNLLAWVGYLIFTIGLVYDSRWGTAVLAGFPLFCALVIWTIHVSFETKAAEQEKGWLYIAIILFGGMTFSAIWLYNLYEMFLG